MLVHGVHAVYDFKHLPRAKNILGHIWVMGIVFHNHDLDSILGHGMPSALCEIYPFYPLANSEAGIFCMPFSRSYTTKLVLV